jgi:hypothetical protein
MSGFKQLDRLSLPRPARRQAIAQDNRKHRNERECRAVSRQLAAVNGRLCRSVQSCGVRIAESEYLRTRILMD